MPETECHLRIVGLLPDQAAAPFLRIGRAITQLTERPLLPWHGPEALYQLAHPVGHPGHLRHNAAQPDQAGEREDLEKGF